MPQGEQRFDVVKRRLRGERFRGAALDQGIGILQGGERQVPERGFQRASIGGGSGLQAALREDAQGMGANKWDGRLGRQSDFIIPQYSDPLTRP